MKWFATLCLCLCCVLASRAAFAQGANEVVAEALFEQGRKLMEERRFDEACEKFAASYQIDHGIGTQLNLARCYKEAGRTATAWSTYKSAAAGANQAGQYDREKLALEEAQKLQQSLNYVTVSVSADAKVSGLQVILDGQSVPGASWGQPFPIDPGKHVLEASAPGHEPFRFDFTVTQAQTPIEVPKLTPSPVAADPSPAATKGPAPSQGAAPSEGPNRTPAWIAFGVGGAGLALGVVGYLGYTAAGNDLERVCSSDGRCPPSADGDISREKTMRTLSLTGFIVGGLGIAAGTTLLVLPSGGGDHAPQGRSVRAYAGLGEIGLVGQF